MLASDLAKLYQCSNGTKTINLAVKRHINRFPERFMFQLTKEEYYSILRFQNETLELNQGQYSKYLPYVFTEQGVAMLATVLRTSVAEEVSIAIMDAFVEMRKYTNNYEKRIFNSSKEKIIIIDNYIDKNLLDVLSKTNKKILIITNKYNNNDYLKYQQQYKNVEIKINNKIHDRFIIIDNKELYHCGASFKDLGKKCFAINKIDNKLWLESLLNYI